ncbi:2-hydroxyhepta-2,4-diene-1,7-dioate isomerase [Burkholderia sp. Bp8992]|uniref:fumarylacetoacetate hydrolase family protein n=1 Tax=Burkholderia TaxID=32008 RepID=UPI000F586442|nr:MULTISPECIES: fumarylacetoacetate hydrolase family protein [Burkholderia]RQS19988.1 2-hydroxyhepta-2,4-diene-1,7-dioate isomerase [Burkholderia sp. Bp8992]
MSGPFLLFDEQPYSLSGIVYGTLLNQRDALDSIGDAACQPPYNARPKAPVLYVKPRNTLSYSGQSMPMPEEIDVLLLRATVGIVISRPASRVTPVEALAHAAGVTLIADLCLPHEGFYRPSMRFVARDGSCFVGPRIAPLSIIGDPDAISIAVEIDGEYRLTTTMGGMIRPTAQLLADVTEFMTLSPGDILMLGACACMPYVRKGQRFEVSAKGIGELQGAIV